MNQTNKTLITATLFILSFSLRIANADVLRVPSNDYPTIQSALDDTFAGDKVLVAGGEYNENLTLITSNIELVGAGQDKTIIAPTHTVSAVINISAGSTVRDLTVRGSRTGVGGTGISFRHSTGTLTNITITNTRGDGIHCNQSSPTITDVTITETGSYGIRCINWSNPKIRNSIITKSDSDGVMVSASSNPDLGTAEDPGNNEIRRNRVFNINNGNHENDDEIQAIGNWWGSDPPNEAFITGSVNFTPWLTEPPLSSLPAVHSIEPGLGTASGGTLITITGVRFVAGATVTVGGNPATGVSVDSETQITAITPAGVEGPATLTVTNPDGGSASLQEAFTYVDIGGGQASVLKSRKPIPNTMTACVYQESNVSHQINFRTEEVRNGF